MLHTAFNEMGHQIATGVLLSLRHGSVQDLVFIFSLLLDACGYADEGVSFHPAQDADSGLWNVRQWYAVGVRQALIKKTIV